MAGEPTAQDGGSTTADAPSAETVYYVRVLQPWTAEASSTSSHFSFFGLELELAGFRENGAARTATSTPLRFDSEGDATLLAGLLPPFRVRVASKLAAPPASAADKLVLQKLVAVQPDNLLLEINGVQFLETCATGTQVLACLQRVASKVSLAKPFELTFQRHNHAQAAAKIVPFATRADVQVAQVAQFRKMQEQEAQLSEDVRRKKQCLTQQIDYEQEQYLVAHIERQLFELHESIMANGQWQAYEFEQALWFYHAATARLYAGHPMRNSATTRRLIGAVQFETRFAVQRLQRAARLSLRRSALAAAVVAHPTLLEAVWCHVWQYAWTRVREEREQKEEQEKRVRSEADSSEEQQPTPSSKTSTEVASPWKKLSAADVAKHGIQAVAPAPSAVAEDANATRTRESPSGPDSSLADDVGVESDVRLVVQENEGGGSGPDSSLAALDAPLEDAIPAPRAEVQQQQQHQRPSEPTVADLKQAQRAVGTETLAADRSHDSDISDDEEQETEWRGYLRLLKSGLKHKRSSPPKHQQRHRHRDFARDAPPTKVSVETQTQTVDDDREDGDRVGRCLPRMSPHAAASPPKRVGCSIAPPRQGDVAPFMLQPRHAHVSESEPLVASSGAPSAHSEPQSDERVLPAPTALRKRVESASDPIDAWPRGGSFRAFHSFFARDLDGPADEIRGGPDAPSLAPEPWKRQPAAPHEPKALTAAELEIVRQSRATRHAPPPQQQSAKTSSKLPYIVRKKAKGPS